MKNGTASIWVPTSIAAGISSIVIAALWVAFPHSRREIDYMAMGSVGVMLGILTVYALSMKRADIAPKRRAIQPRATHAREFVSLNLDTRHNAPA